MSDNLSHIDESGTANMVDVGGKEVSTRTATAESLIQFSKSSFESVLKGNNKKGDVFGVARIAGIQAAKKCSELIPLCHPLMLTKISVDIEAIPTQCQIRVQASCGLDGKTGVEMEALTAASIAALTIYDMCKALDKDIEIINTRLLDKCGGKSGDWARARNS